ncbi:MAG TPA: dihydroorotate dehydrogenase [Halanaerobiales bacterium]|nr:dihydroorotate dehydrogenase [Halanaerobiales bacterium]
MNKNNLKTKLANLKLKNPVITASGTFGFGTELDEYLSVKDLGAITLKGITVDKSEGNALPRIAETPAGVLNSIGLENPGIDNFKQEVIPEIATLEVPAIANISGYSVKDFVQLAESLEDEDCIDAIEVNVSCPNIKDGGMAFGTDPEMIYRVTREVAKVYSGTIIVKLSPNVTDIVKMAEAAVEGGADIISLINTLLGMAIDIDKKEPVLANTFGGLSGPAVKPVALRMVYQIYEAIDVPIIGMGGIMNGKDAIEFLLAGASAVGVGTATLRDPAASVTIVSQIKEYLEENNIENISEIIGEAHK